VKVVFPGAMRALYLSAPLHLWLPSSGDRPEAVDPSGRARHPRRRNRRAPAMHPRGEWHV